MTSFPTNPTRNDLIEKYWYEFLKFQQAEIGKRTGNDPAISKTDFSEGAFWAWLTAYRLQGE